jgi:hypothetical protein
MVLRLSLDHLEYDDAVCREREGNTVPTSYSDGAVPWVNSVGHCECVEGCGVSSQRRRVRRRGDGKAERDRGRYGRRASVGNLEIIRVGVLVDARNPPDGGGAGGWRCREDVRPEVVGEHVLNPV